MKRLVAGISVIVLATGCATRLNSSDYLAYVQSHEQEFQVSTVSAATYQLSYQPVEQIVAENISNFSKEEIKDEYKKMKSDSNSSFALQITVSEGNLFSKSKESKTTQMEYYSVYFKHDIKAITHQSDTLSCNGYLFQASGGFGNSAFFQFEFADNIENLKELLLVPKYLEDGTIVIPLSSLHHNYPELKIKQ